MADKLKGKPGFAGWRHAVWVFIKAQLSSYVASLIDFLVTILLVKLSGLFYLYATFLGSVVGGVVNCVINYGWVFHADDCKKTHVALKYLFVWGGSILLNTWGTFALTEWLTGMHWAAPSISRLSATASSPPNPRPIKAMSISAEAL